MENYTETFGSLSERKGITFLKDHGLMPEDYFKKNLNEFRGTITEQKGIAFLKDNGLICICMKKE